MRITTSTLLSVYTMLGFARPLVSSFVIRRGPTTSLSQKLDGRRLSSLASSVQQSKLTEASPKVSNTNSVSPKLRNTGGLRRLPVVKAPKEIINRARTTARRVKPDKEVKNMRARTRKQGAETLNALSQALCIPLRDVVRGYKYEWGRLHPFERVVADLTARTRQKRDGLTLNQVLDEINEARKMILEATKDWIAKIKNSESSKEADDAMKDGIENLVQLFEDFAVVPVSGILELQRSLRSAPIVQLDTPAVVLVGSPNVGKSSIVRAISSATPEVNNYPFTTRGMTLGHVEVYWSDDSSIVKAKVPDSRRRKAGLKTSNSDASVGQYSYSQLCQIMDSPGLLVRPDHERNEMESLTLAAMQHLPTAVMYVMDLTGEAGEKCSSMQDQLQLRREVRQRFPRRPWIDVVSKIDLGVDEAAMKELNESILDGAPCIQLSIHEGTGVKELRSEVLRMLSEVRVVLDAMAAVDTTSQDTSHTEEHASISETQHTATTETQQTVTTEQR